MDVFGVVESVTWGSGAGAPISFSAYISQASAGQIRSVLKSGLTSVKVHFKFVIYDYDAATKMYYQGFFPVIPDSPTSRLTGVLTPQSLNPQKYQISVGDSGTKVRPGHRLLCLRVLCFYLTGGQLQQRVAIGHQPPSSSARSPGCHSLAPTSFGTYRFRRRRADRLKTLNTRRAALPPRSLAAVSSARRLRFLLRLFHHVQPPSNAVDLG